MDRRIVRSRTRCEEYHEGPVSVVPGLVPEQWHGCSVECPFWQGTYTSRIRKYQRTRGKRSSWDYANTPFGPNFTRFVFLGASRIKGTRRCHQTKSHEPKIMRQDILQMNRRTERPICC